MKKLIAYLVLLNALAISQYTLASDRGLEYPTYFTNVNGLGLAYQDFGDPDDDAVLLIMGLGAQLIHWPDDLVLGLVEQGYRVIRYDNRDAGLSGKLHHEGTPGLFELIKYKLGLPVGAPYSLADMASDGIGLLDQLGIEKAHVAGVSMGGMIAQIMAAQYPDRIQTLTSIMSTSGDPDLPQGSTQPGLKDQAGLSRDEIITQNAKFATQIDGSVAELTLEQWKKNMGRSYDRAHYPAGFGRQILAIIDSGDRVDLLKTVQQPTVVIHGKEDTLIPYQGAEHTAKLVQNAKLVLLDGMGHFMDDVNRPKILAEMTTLFNDHRYQPVIGDNRQQPSVSINSAKQAFQDKTAKGS